MHSVEELGTNVPAFLAKLWKIVEDPKTNDLICWSSNGESFLIRDQARFSRELLPLYYKHNNMASFVRQLNMYGFHKVVSIEGGGLKVEKDEMEFAHQFFMMGHPYLLEHIKRKMPTSKGEEGRTGAKPELSKVLADVTTMKGRQDSLDSQLSAMKRENEVLWREVAILREKHMKQQHIVNKLIQFLVTLVQSSRNGGFGIKRHYPLMLNDTSHCPRKMSKPSSELSNLNSTTPTLSPTGPVIHELDTTELFESCETLPGERSVKKAYFPTELCSVVIGDEPFDYQGSTPDLNPNEPPPGSPDLITSNTNTEELLELAEECPLSPSLLLTASPMDVTPAVDTQKLFKDNNNSDRENLFGNKRKRLKRSKSGSKTSVSAATSTPSISSKLLSAAATEGVDLLDLVLPTTGDLKTYRSREAANHIEDSVADATDAAMSGINMTIASKNKPFRLTDPLGSKLISRSQLDGILPVSSVTNSRCAGVKLADSAVSDSDASGNAKPKTSDLMLFTQEPSTSSDQSGTSSNMMLACTGVNSEENYLDRTELDSRLDSVQLELESLLERFRGQEYSLDANTLLGLFGEDLLPATAFENLLEDRDKQNTGGSEIATYAPTLSDVDMLGTSDVGEWSSPSSPESSSVLNTPRATVVSPGAKKLE